MFNFESKSNRHKFNAQADLSLFLKRRRLELGIKLEELSNGICSTSYLSRIENALVDVDDSYMKALFEKMNIDYDEVRENRSRNLYHEIMKANIMYDYNRIEELVSHAIKCKSYIDLEIELFLLFFNIVKENYEEARKILLKIDAVQKGLSGVELIFYLYCFAMYAYKTNQTKKAYQQMLILAGVNYDDVFMESCIYDLGIDIMEKVGCKELCWKYYHQLEKIAIMPLFGGRLHLHKLKLLLFESIINKDIVISEFEEKSKYLDLDNKVIKEDYLYHLALVYYNNKDYVEVVNLLKENMLSARITSVIASSLIKEQNINNYHSIIDLVDNYKYTKHETYYMEFCKFIKLVIDGNPDYFLLNYIKNILLINNNYYDYIIEKEKRKYYAGLLISCGKYKEGAREYKKSLDEDEHKKLI